MGSIEKLRHGLGVAMFSLGERTCSESVSASFTCMISAKMLSSFSGVLRKKGGKVFRSRFLWAKQVWSFWTFL